MGKVGKHRCVIGGVSNINDVFLDSFHILTKNFFKQKTGHREFIIFAEPAVDVDGAGFGHGTGLFEQVDDLFDRFGGQRWNVFTKIYRQIRFTIGLVGLNTGTWNFFQYLPF